MEELGIMGEGVIPIPEEQDSSTGSSFGFSPDRRSMNSQESSSLIESPCFSPSLRMFDESELEEVLKGGLSGGKERGRGRGSSSKLFTIQEAEISEYDTIEVEGHVQQYISESANNNKHTVSK